jgi:hypothetical protein
MTAIWLLLDELADFPMMRKCLLGTKRRAEAHAAASLRPWPAAMDRDRSWPRIISVPPEGESGSISTGSH